MATFVRQVGLMLTALVLVACGSNDDPEAPSPTTDEAGDAAAADQEYPDVIDVTVESSGDTYTFEVTISSPYDSPERYADGWRILDEQGNKLDEHTLLHDHAAEQPFTRTQSDVEIPPGVSTVIVEGRDTENGYGGQTFEVSIDE